MTADNPEAHVRQGIPVIRASRMSHGNHVSPPGRVISVIHSAHANHGVPSSRLRPLDQGTTMVLGMIWGGWGGGLAAPVGAGGRRLG